MENPTFIDEENIPMVQDEDYDDYRTPDTSRIDASFMKPDATEAASTLRLRQELKQDNINTLYRYLRMTGDTGLACLDQLMIKKNPKTSNTNLLFPDGNNYWQSLTNKRTGGFLESKTLRKNFRGLNTMESVLILDETPPALERSFKAATKLKADLPTDLEMESIPLKELSSLVEDIDVKT